MSLGGWHALRYSEGRAWPTRRLPRPSEYLRACHPISATYYWAPPYGPRFTRVGPMQKPLRTSGLEPPGVTSFLQSVLRSGLLDQAQLRESLRTVPAERRTSPES